MNKEVGINASDGIYGNLNKEQKAAILNIDSPLRIIAGAGSGKTGVLTKKIVYLIRKINIKPERIMALTFTNKAANEMKSRVIDIIGEKGLDVVILTFHALCSKFLKREIHNIGYYNKFIILDSSDQRFILRNIYKDLEISSSIISYATILSYISKSKTSLSTPADEKKIAISDTDLLKCEVYKRYDEEVKKKKYLDFDDLLIFTNQILVDFPEIADYWKKQFDYILVDEFQDTSILQYNIIKNISNKKNITIVGDPDQTIYSWRGADINSINNFHQDFPNTTTITMDTNYRSTKKILDAANRLIRSNKNRMPKSLNTFNEVGEGIEFHYAYSQEEEARWVVNKINELKRNKIQLKDIAIFYRSNFYSRLIESALLGEAINHKIFGGQKFYELSEIKDAISFLWTISKDTPQLHFHRILNIPSRKIGPATEAKLLSFANEKKLNLYEALIENYKVLPVSKEIKAKIVEFLNEIRRHKRIIEKRTISISKTLESFLNAIKYLKAIKESSNENDTKYENIMELLKAIDTWETNNPNLGLEDYLEEIKLINMSFDLGENAINYITLMTIHASKGLEFKNVFLIGLNEDIFPSNKVNEIDDDDLREEKMEEERRLAYVAITRAKERLFVSGARGSSFISNIVQQKLPSRFISEMGLDVSAFVSDLVIIKNFKNDIKINKNYVIGDVVSHITFGKGIVLDLDGDKITIKFNNDTVGVKQFIKNHKSIERVE